MEDSIFMEVLRYDTNSPFNSNSSWNAYDASNTNGLNTIGYTGTAFDERFLYFSPFQDGTNFHGRVLRYDTNSSFNFNSSWNAYDASNTNGLTAAGYFGAIFDGRFVYFSPLIVAPGTYDGIVLDMIPELFQLLHQHLFQHHLFQLIHPHHP